MHEQVHIAAWPSFSCLPQAYSLGPVLNQAVSQTYAAEGGCFMLAPCGVISQTMYDVMVENDDQAALINVGGGHAQIYAPDGSPMCDGTIVGLNFSSPCFGTFGHAAALNAIGATQS